MQRIIFLIGLMVASVFVAQFSSCKKDNFLNEGGSLRISTDTLYFDTVFTTLGSVTHQFKIINRNDRPVRVNNIRIEKGENSFFRLNVDGTPTKNISNVEIAANDSVYVFAAVTVDPNNDTNPFVIDDKVLIDFNDKSYEVALQAYGQNAHFIRGPELLQTQTWVNDLPYVIVNDGSLTNSALIDSNHVLTIEKGCRIYMRATSKLYVAGRLLCDGTRQDSIIFQGDRLDRSYFGQDFPGEWRGLHFLSSSRGSKFTHVIIKNGGASDASILLQPPSTPIPASSYMLEMNKCRVENSLGHGIISFGSSLTMNNCLIHSCGLQTFAGVLGGRYRLNYCTFATYSGNGISHINQPTMILANFFQLSQTEFDYGSLDAELKNCIIYGSLENELTMANQGPGQYVASFENCLIRRTNQWPNVVGNTNNIFNQDPQFIDRNEWDYSVQNSSPAKGNAQALPAIMEDIIDNTRGAAPTIGCFE